MRKLLVFVAILLLSGCHIFDTPSDPGGKKPGGDPGVIVTPPDEPDPNIVPPPLPEKTVNWPVSLELVVEQMIRGSAIKESDVLLVDNVKNNSDTDLDIDSLTSQLKQTVASAQHFALAPENQVSTAKQALNLQDDDSLNSRNKTIGLARYLAIPYILYTTISGQGSDVSLVSQIMQVQTGELIWSEKIPVRLD